MRKNEILEGKFDHFLINSFKQNLLFRNPLWIEHWRKKGVKRRNRLIGVYKCLNGITNVGKNYILNVAFNTASQIANNSWFIGLIDNAGFSALAAADTMASHAGWAESTAYTETTRVAWGSGSSTAQSTSNASPAVFDINASGTMNGIFVNSDSTKGGTTGTLWSTASFTSTVPVASSDQLKVTYSVTC